MTHQATDNLNRPISSICPGVTQRLTVTAANAQSAAFGAGTAVVRIVSSVDAHYVGDWIAAAATTSHSFLPAGVVEYVNVPRGSKISILRASGDGFATMTEGL